jgi:regulator of protease activity HflC (stomatin/prohibitin superfamily)
MESIKGLIEYLLNIVKFWIVIQPWERGIRVRFGKNQKLLSGGVHFRIPFLDTFYIQCIRLRVISMPIQTLTSKDIKTVTLNGSIGYEISNVELLYNNMVHPELTVSNIAMGAISDFIYQNDMASISAIEIEKMVLNTLKETEKYGIRISYFKLLNFAVVRTYRLIQDQSWSDRGINLTESK